MTDYLKSPFNYTGSKYKLLPQLIPLFPKENITTFVDLFTGGGSVGMNVHHIYDTIVLNDCMRSLMEFYDKLQIVDWGVLLERIKKEHILPTDAEGYSKLRDRYNESHDPFDFFMLSCCCTNNMIRFNQKGKFNQTFGKRWFNPVAEQKLYEYWKLLYKNEKIILANKNFYDLEILDKSFVYLDPPYFLSEAGYNMRWGNELEKRLYDYLECLNNRDIKFAMSNVLEHKGKVNHLVNSLVGKYNLIELDCHYKKVSRATEESTTKEILLTNYDLKESITEL